MAEEFTPITTQEDLNKIIGERLTRERESTAKKYADYDDIKGKNAEYAKQIEALNKQVEESSKKDSTILKLQSQIKKYEVDSVKNKVAYEVGLNPQFASRLNGDTEDDIRKDALSVMEMFSKSKHKSPEQSDDAGKGKGDSKDNAFRALLDGVMKD